MRFLLDTNVLIPLEDSQLPLVPSLASFVRLANSHGHPLLYHPASEDDIREDTRVLLFRFVRHLNRAIPFSELTHHRVLNGHPQSLTSISHDAFQSALAIGG